MKPVTPKQLSETLFLDENMKKVIEVINEFLTKKFKGGSVVIKQEEIINEIHDRFPEISHDEINDCGLLNFTHIYDQFGWIVSYETPTYNDTTSFNPYYIFKPKTITTLYG
jgi:hypothetical protein